MQLFLTGLEWSLFTQFNKLAIQGVSAKPEEK